ncbi:MAG: PQQ-binding-like beta-propeller repeat protein, partial [Myxococcales bacterium]|nr:PQQ-binding-like beta-propeller repeat protein [Myxococcales bacterium]
AATGQTRWRKKAQRDTLEKVAIAVDESIVTAAWPDEAVVFGFAVNSGREKWRHPLEAMPTSLAACTEHRVVAVTHRDGETLVATALDPKTGDRLWRTPVDGALVGAGAGHLFTAVMSGTGRLKARIQAIDCATGAVHDLPDAGRKLVDFLAAGEGFVALRHFEFGFTHEQVCLHPLKADAAPDCFAPGDGQVANYNAVGGLFKDGRFYFSTAHAEAHNLNPDDDAWLFARDLATRRTVWRSPPMLSRGPAVDAGALLWVGFGTTGAADHATLIDPVDGQPVAQLSLRKAPEALAVDPERAFVASYDGHIAAIALPRPGRKPAARAPVTPQGSAAATAVAGPPDTAWKVVAAFDAKPKRAKSSGTLGDGTADTVAFLDPAGALLAVGGNDDRVAVFASSSGKRQWQSPAYGKDIVRVHAANDRFAAEIYDGRTVVFAPKGKGFTEIARIAHGQSWTTGFAPDGNHLVADAFNDSLTLFAVPGGAQIASLPLSRGFDHRGVQLREGLVAVPAAEGVLIARVEKSGFGTPQAVTLDFKPEGREMTQAWMVNPNLLLAETCGPAECVIDLRPIDGRPTHTLRFDTRGAGWSPSVPSTLAMTREADAMFFFRLGLAPIVVDLSSDERTPIARITGQAAAEYTTAAFSSDGKRLAIGMHPKPWQVTVLAR